MEAASRAIYLDGKDPFAHYAIAIASAYERAPQLAVLAAEKGRCMPLGREIRRCADRQRAGAPALQQPLRSRGDSVEGVTHHHKVVASRIGDEQPLPLPIEDPDGKLCLQRLDLVADRAVRDA